MTRFARADGSKGSNKRVLEEATPWAQLKKRIDKPKAKPPTQPDSIESTDIQTATTSDLPTKKKKNKTEKEIEYKIGDDGRRIKIFKDGTERPYFDLPYEEGDRMTRFEGFWVQHDDYDKLNELKNSLVEQGLDKHMLMKKLMKAKRKAHTQLRKMLIYEQRDILRSVKPGKTQVNQQKKGKVDNFMEEKSPKKKTKKQKNEERVEEMEGIEIQGEAVEETGIALSKKKKESDIMEIQEHHEYGEIHNIKKKKKKRDLNENEHEVREEIKQEKNIDLEENGEEIQSNKKNKKNKKTPDIKDDQEEIYDNNYNEINKKKKKKRSRNDLEENQEENEEIQNIKDKKVKIEENEGEIKPKKKKNKDKKIRGNSDFDNTDEKPNKKDINSNTSNIDETTNNHFNTTKNQFKNRHNQQQFKENFYVAFYEGYWIRRAAIPKLEAMKIIRHNQILEERQLDSSKGKSVNEKDKTESAEDKSDSDDQSNSENIKSESKTEKSDTEYPPDGKLTEAETIKWQRLMKKEKRNEAEKLRKDPHGSGEYWKEYDGFSSYVADGRGEDSPFIKFEGFWVRREAANRLHKLKDKLKAEGLTDGEVFDVLKKERRKEERAAKADKNTMCFKCRETGHVLANCPLTSNDDNAIPSTGICFKCGSTEHISSSCTTKSKDCFAFASCFICNERGHISRNCPDNPKGLYPQGGCCKICSSVEHLAKDCPDLQGERQNSQIKLHTINVNKLEALDEYEEQATPTSNQSKQNKKIVFD